MLHRSVRGTVAVRWFERFRCLSLVGPVWYPAEHHVVYRLYVFPLRAGWSLHHLFRNQAEQHILGRSDVLHNLGNRPSLWRRFEVPLGLRKSPRSVENVLFRALQMFERALS